MNTKKIHFVILKKPYDTFSDSVETRDFLGKVFKLKLDGYTKYYPYGILPISDVDFMADHLVVCHEINGELIPVSGVKSIRYSTCSSFNVPFPAINHLFDSQSDLFPVHKEAIKNWSNQLTQKGEDFVYFGSWTMSPFLSKEDRSIVRDLNFAIICFFHRHERIRNLINATSTTNSVHIHEEKMGFNYLQDKNGKELGTFQAHNFAGKPFALMHITGDDFLDDYIRSIDKFKSLWDNRKVIGEEISRKKDQAA